LDIDVITAPGNDMIDRDRWFSPADVRLKSECHAATDLMGFCNRRRQMNWDHTLNSLA
jgi:hypothetical protein